MDLKGVEQAGVKTTIINFDTQKTAQKQPKQAENLQELLSNPAKKSAENSFFSEHKTLSVIGGFLAAGALLFVTKKINLALKAYKKNLAKKAKEKFLQETRDFIAKETESFYKETQSLSNVYIFERNKMFLSEALNKSPKELGLWEEEYAGFIDFLRQNGLRKEIIQNKIAQAEYKTAYWKLENVCNFDCKKADKIYYNQREFLNPDLVKIKSQISPRKLSFNYADDPIQSHFGKEGYTLKEIKKMLSESEGLTLESGSLLTKSNYRDEIYDLPFKFASASYNSLAKNGNAYIKTEIPAIFKGIDEKELFESLDILSTHIRESAGGSFPKGSVINFKIGKKAFKCTSLGYGMEGSVYKISAEGGKPVVIKTYFASYDHSPFGVTFAPSGLYGGLGVLREANMAKVVDVPKLYMANPIYTPINGPRSGYMGAWQLTEDANLKQAETGLRFRDWLKSKKLYWSDNKEEAWVNGICIDTGFIMNNIAHKDLISGWGSYGLNKIYSRYLNGETTGQILEFLNRTA